MSDITKDKILLWGLHNGAHDAVQAGIFKSISDQNLSDISQEDAFTLADGMSKSTMFLNALNREQWQIKVLGDAGLKLNCAQIFSRNLNNTQDIYTQFNVVKNITNFITQISAPAAGYTYATVPYAVPLFFDTASSNASTMNTNFTGVYCDTGARNSIYAGKITQSFSLVGNTTVLSQKNVFFADWDNICAQLAIGNNDVPAKTQINATITKIDAYQKVLTSALTNRTQNLAWEEVVKKLPSIYMACKDQTVSTTQTDVDATPDKFYGRKLKIALETDPIDLNAVNGTFASVITQAKQDLGTDALYYQTFCNSDNSSVINPDSFCSV